MVADRLRLAVARVLGRIERARYITVGGDDLSDLMVRVGLWLYQGMAVYVDPRPATSPPAPYQPAACCELPQHPATPAGEE